MTIAIPLNLRSLSSIAFSRSLRADSASQMAASTFPNVSNVKARKTMPHGMRRDVVNFYVHLDYCVCHLNVYALVAGEIVDSNCFNSFFVPVQLLQQADLAQYRCALGDGQVVASDVVRHTG